MGVNQFWHKIFTDNKASLIATKKLYQVMVAVLLENTMTLAAERLMFAAIHLEYNKANNNNNKTFIYKLHSTQANIKIKSEISVVCSRDIVHYHFNTLIYAIIAIRLLCITTVFAHNTTFIDMGI